MPYQTGGSSEFTKLLYKEFPRIKLLTKNVPKTMIDKILSGHFAYQATQQRKTGKNSKRPTPSRHKVQSSSQRRESFLRKNREINGKAGRQGPTKIRINFLHRFCLSEIILGSVTSEKFPIEITHKYLSTAIASFGHCMSTDLDTLIVQE